MAIGRGCRRRTGTSTYGWYRGPHCLNKAVFPAETLVLGHAHNVNTRNPFAVKVMVPHLAWVVMTEDELQAERRRRGYWLRLARQRAGSGGSALNQSVVAKAIGLSENSGPANSDMEKGNRDPSATELMRLARLYNVPVSWFSEPRPTVEEDLLGAKAGMGRTRGRGRGVGIAGAGERPRSRSRRRRAASYTDSMKAASMAAITAGSVTCRNSGHDCLLPGPRR